MCGIVGAIAERDVSKILVAGLKRLEYRGYDSAGVAILNKDYQLQRLRTLGKVNQLEQALEQQPLLGSIGIAHTRWATHGKPAEHNAHPHASGNDVVLVHNGIVENHEELREKLKNQGYEFSSETDTEVIAHLLHAHLQKNSNLLQAVKETVDELEGAYALGIIYAKQPDRLIAVRCGSPLVIGIGIGEHFLASDTLALLPVTQQFVFLEEGDIAEIHLNHFQIYDENLKPVTRNLHQSSMTGDAADRGEYRHYMLKEIFEQPRAISETMESRLTDHHILEEAFGMRAKEIFAQTERVQIVACGTSYHAGMVARYWLEEIAGIPCQVEIASEIRYRHTAIAPKTLFITISQSGETADTLAALRQAKDNPNFLASLCICNVPESSLVRESDLVIMTRAGTEVGVASTKAFTTQLIALLMLTILLGRHHQLSKEQEANLISQIKSLPRLIENTLTLNNQIENLANLFMDKEHTLFLGRGTQFPIALEGALKLKEISYIHAEAYPAGELKHGPLALVDSNMPVVTLLAHDHLVDKVKSNIQEVQARGGQTIIFADEKINYQDENSIVLNIPSCEPILAPIVMTIPLQLLAYHVAVLKGTDVDQPRNLAKSVTVE